MFLNNSFIPLKLIVYLLIKNLFQAVCDAMLKTEFSTGAPEEVLLTTVYSGLQVYFNFTSTAKCLDITQSADSKLDDRGWDYRVIRMFIVFSIFLK